MSEAVDWTPFIQRKPTRMWVATPHPGTSVGSRMRADDRHEAMDIKKNLDKNVSSKSSCINVITYVKPNSVSISPVMENPNSTFMDVSDNEDLLNKGFYEPLESSLMSAEVELSVRNLNEIRCQNTLDDHSKLDHGQNSPEDDSFKNRADETFNDFENNRNEVQLDDNFELSVISSKPFEDHATVMDLMKFHKPLASNSRPMVGPILDEKNIFDVSFGTLMDNVNLNIQLRRPPSSVCQIADDFIEQKCVLSAHPAKSRLSNSSVSTATCGLSRLEMLTAREKSMIDLSDSSTFGATMAHQNNINLSFEVDKDNEPVANSKNSDVDTPQVGHLFYGIVVEEIIDGIAYDKNGCRIIRDFFAL